MVSNKRQLFGVVSETDVNIDYTGLTTDTSKTTVNNRDRTIAVDVDITSLLGTSADKFYPGSEGLNNSIKILTLFNKLDDETKRAKLAEKELSDSIYHAVNTLDDYIANVAQRLNSLTETESAHFESLTSNLNESVTTLQRTIESNDKAVRYQIEQTRINLYQSLENLIKQTKSELQEQDSANKEELLSVIDDVESKLDQLIRTVSNNLSTKISQLKTYVEESDANLNTSIDLFKDQTSVQFEAIDNQIADISNQLSNSISNVSNSLEDFKNETIDEFENVEGTIATLTSDIEAEISDINKHIDLLRSDCESEFTEIASSFADVTEKINSVNDDLQGVESALLTSIENLANDISNSETDISDLQERDNELSESINTVKSDLESKLHEEKQTLQENLDAAKVVILTQITELTAQLTNESKTRAEEDNKINNSIQQTAEELTNSITATKEELESELSEITTQVSSEIAPQLAALEDLIKKYHPTTITSMKVYSNNTLVSSKQHKPTELNNLKVEWISNNPVSTVMIEEKEYKTIEQSGDIPQITCNVTLGSEVKLSQTNPTITLQCDSKTQNVTVTFTDYVYFGDSDQDVTTSPSESFIKGLINKNLQTSNARSMQTYNCSKDKWFYFASPTSYGEPIPSTKVGDATFDSCGEVELVYGDYKKTYRLYRLPNKSLGTFELEIK